MTATHIAAAAVDVDTFEALAAAEGTRLVRACVVLTGNRSDGEDLAQEALARVLERWDRVSTMASPAGYLYRTAMNLHRSRLRRLGRTVRQVKLEHERFDDTASSDTRLDVLRAIGSLPRAQREAVVLIEWLGYSAEESGRILGIEPVSVRARLHRARTTLRTLLGDDDA